MPVAVAGMHRSGTSMIAKALHLAGLFLGEEADLIDPTPDNPDGYWENARFVDVNDEILAALGGGWDSPPAVPRRFEEDPRLRGLRQRAKKLGDEFRTKEPWGWKDPRNSLTVPLWLQLFPELKVVVCLRNPLAVALSLHQRYFSYSTALELWETYNRRVVESVASDQILVTDYEAWISRPAAEIRRTLGFLGLPMTRGTVESARSAVKPDLHHNRFTDRDLLDLEIAPELVELYAWLRREARSRPGSGRVSDSLPPERQRRSAGAVVDIRRLDAEHHRRRAERLNEELTRRDAALKRVMKIEQEERLRRVEVSSSWAALLERVEGLENPQRWRTLTERVARLEDSEPYKEPSEAQERLLGMLGELREGYRGLSRRIEELQATATQGVGESQKAQARLIQAIEDLQGSVYNLQAGGSHGVQPEDSDYRQLVRRIQEVVRTEIPFDSTVIVVSKGDETLVDLYGRQAWHFPQNEEGRWAGYHPKSSLPAIAHLESLRANGGDYLLFPATALWWLDEYSGLRRHLEQRYRMARRTDGTCLIFSLRERPDTGPSWREELTDVIEEFRGGFGRDPALLDWHTGLELSGVLPEHAVFSPPVEGNGLPYIDGSIDLVVLGGIDPASLAEAKRVASAAVIAIPGKSENGEVAEVHWQKRPPTATPSVSIVIPCHNGLPHTTACLQTLSETLPSAFRGEVIVVDDASSDATAVWLDELSSRDSRIRVIRNTTNRGFLHSVTRGAEAADGDMLLFLNNDTVLLPGWLPPLLRVFAERKDAGAVGGRLLYPDGRLQEAGGLVFADGSAWKLGYGELDPEASIYSYLREVDYCSGCLLATPRALFEELGGFDKRYAPGFYEDTDYCLAVRKHGLRVIYQPESTIVHAEGGTAGTDLERGPKRYQVVNQKKFERKWRKELKQQPRRPDVLDTRSLEALAAARGRVVARR
jgi:GT2 family glycosyltransferase